MAESENGKAEASAEKAYAKALETIPPAKMANVAELGVTAQEPEAKPAVAPEKPVADPVAAAMVIPSVKPKVAGKPAPAVKAVPMAKPVAKAVAKPAAKPAVKKAIKPAAKPVAKLVKKVAKPVKTTPKKIPAAAPAIAPAAAATFKKSTTPTQTAFAKTKDTTMTIKTKITEGLETVMSEAQTKAKEAFEKSSAFLGDYAVFAKGNVEAVVESGKILAEGLQDMGTNLVAEGRSTFETVSADIKDMAAAKLPTDLIQLQSDMFRKSFDSAVAYGSKNTEAMLKIASDAIAPISSRVSLAVEKVRQVAA